MIRLVEQLFKDNMKKVLEVEGLKKNYKKVKAVKGIDFNVYQNEIFGLVGPNGAGKSTTLRILATVLAPSSGKVTLDGLDLIKDQAEVRKIISYLPEEAGAYKSLTGSGYLSFMAAVFGSNKKEKNDYYDFAVEICGLKNRLKEKVGTYSKGMVRKLLLARTVMSRPKLLILDEPTSGLDIINAVEVRKIIRTLADEGSSIILSSHNMLETEFLSDRIAIINKGEIVQEGTPGHLKQKLAVDNLEEVFIKSV